MHPVKAVTPSPPPWYEDTQLLLWGVAVAVSAYVAALGMFTYKGEVLPHGLVGGKKIAGLLFVIGSLGTAGNGWAGYRRWSVLTGR